jgi:O-antigen/teichoic acid export membrane protein
LSKAVHQTYLLLILAAPLFILAPPIQAFLHLKTILPCLLGIALFVFTFAAAIPSAMLLAYGRFWSLAIIGVVESLFRLLLFVPFFHHWPIDVAIALSILVTLVGGIAMMLVAHLRGPKVPIFDQGARSPTAKHWVFNSLIGLGLFLPFVIPLWIARDLLESKLAGTISIAGFLAGGALFLAGPVASSMVPKSALGIDLTSLRRASALCLLVALTTSIAAWTLGPALIPVLIHRNTEGLRLPLGLMSLAVPGWAVVGYWAWIGASRGNSYFRYFVSLLSGIGAQIVFAFTIPKPDGVEVGPLISLAVCSLVLIVGRRWETGVRGDFNSELRTNN